MSRKDFQRVAATIAGLDQLGWAAQRYVAEQFADALAETNPRFDRAKFLAACGIDA